MYKKGLGVEQNDEQADCWFITSILQGDKKAETQGVQGWFLRAQMYSNGDGVIQSYKQAAKWYRKAAEYGFAYAQFNLAIMYNNGEGVVEDYAEAYKWFLLAGMNGLDVSERKMELQKKLSPFGIEKAQKLAREFVAKKAASASNSISQDHEQVKATGTGFFVTGSGYMLTAFHVVENTATVKVSTSAGTYPARIVLSDKANDIAILKVDGTEFIFLNIVPSSSVTVGQNVFTLGFPNVGTQGTEAKYTEGTISSLSGTQNNTRVFQISTPIQPGNSGGPLVTEDGKVIGMVVAKLNDMRSLLASGTVPQNVNYAVKSSFILPFLESIPDVQFATKKAYPKMASKADIISHSKKALGLILCY